ncbi:MAG: SRPBCC family protein [Nitrospiraceae bacterium]
MMRSSLLGSYQTIRALAFLCFLQTGPVSFGLAWDFPVAWAAEERAPVLEVRTEPSGGVRATGVLHLPAPSSVVQAVLTDYEKWPELFDMSMRVTRVERHAEYTVTDLALGHALMIGERRLVLENRELRGGGLVSRFVAGDFTRYLRTWKLRADGEQSRTRADFELQVDFETLVPAWLVAQAVRRELEAHFRILTETVAKRVASH